jgi:anthranilate phosphoribosyltransferase
MGSRRSLAVGGPEESMGLLNEAIDGVDGLPREIVALNAGAALYAAGRAVSIAEGIDQARAAIGSGAARAKLDQFVAATRRLAGT